MNFLGWLLCIWSDWNIFEWTKLLWRHYIKFKKAKLVETSYLPSMWIHCSIYTCRDESEIYNYQWIQLSNNILLFINGILGVHFTWLDYNQPSKLKFLCCCHFGCHLATNSLGLGRLFYNQSSLPAPTNLGAMVTKMVPTWRVDNWQCF